ncbi:hypothetical protein, partial [Pengzhenrongella frigida]|uniref:hypothetical protein n=1 Tax=Pengzhenrongella frigida TaxID=1259133 RepID=UPI001A925621
MSRSSSRVLLLLLLSLIHIANIAPDIGGRAEDDSAIIDGLLGGSDGYLSAPAGAVGADPDPDVAYLRSGTCPNPAPGTLD